MTASADFFLAASVLKMSVLAVFHEPVAVIAPDEVVELLGDGIKLVAPIGRLDRVDGFVQAGQNLDPRDQISYRGKFPTCPVIRSQVGNWRHILHLPEPAGIPKFGGEIAAFFDLFLVESNVLPARGDSHQAEPQAVGAIFIDQLERVRRVA